LCDARDGVDDRCGSSGARCSAACRRCGGRGRGVWLTVGRALRPVEQLRAGAEAVTAAESSLRMPVPAAEDEVRRLAETLNGMLDWLEAGGWVRRLS
jgi:HAMP domain-containing protein